MPQKIICLALTLLLFVAASSCNSDITEVNKYPLAISRPEPVQVLTFALTTYSNNNLSGLGTQIDYVVHYVGSTHFAVAGGLVDANASNDAWATRYAAMLGNLRALEAQPEITGSFRENTKTAKGLLDNKNLRVITKTLSAMMFFELTCIFGDIPFSEALNPKESRYPKFDAQEQVLDGVVSMLDEAMALADEVPSKGIVDLSGELLLGGQMERWKEFANSLKIRTLMLIRNVDARKADAEQKLADAFRKPVISAPVHFEYYNSNAYQNLLSRFFEGEGNNEIARFYGSSPTLRDILVKYNDPRLRLWLTDLSETGTYPTQEYGRGPGLKHTVYSRSFIRSTSPDVFMLPSELDFYRAELILGNVLTGSAQAAFEHGLRSVLRYWGGDIPGFEGERASDEEISNCIAKLGAVDLKKIHEQLWLESVFRPVVAWNTVRRTGVPELKPPPSAIIKTILKRYPTPLSEIQSNPNAPASLSTDTPMWFENKK